MLFKDSGKKETFVCSPNDYDARLCVIDLFDKHLKRNPTPTEISRYSENKTKQEIINQIKKDFPTEFEEKNNEDSEKNKRKPSTVESLSKSIQDAKKKQNDPESFKEKNDKKKEKKEDENEDDEEDEDEEEDEEEEDEEEDEDEEEEDEEEDDNKDENNEEKTNTSVEQKQNIPKMRNEDSVLVSRNKLLELQRHLRQTSNTMESMLLNAK